MANLNIKLVKSLNGRIAKHKATRGKIANIGYLLQVTEEN